MKKKYQIILLSLLLIITIGSLLFSLMNNKNKSHKNRSNIITLNSIANRNYKVIKVSFPQNSDPATQIQHALDTAKHTKQPIKVVIPEGKYILNKSLHIYSNTWLYTSPNTIFSKSSNNSGIMLLNGDFNATYYGYDGNSNIIIDGGIWDGNSMYTPSIFGISHGKNIIIQNATVKNVKAGHAIDCAGNENIEIRNNKFLGYHRLNNEVYVEAIQIDGMISNRSFQVFGSVDLTVSQNIKIINNFFGNSNIYGMNPWGVAIGSHSAAYKKPYSTIDISNNTFDNMTYAAVRIHNWKNVSIYNNFFKGCKQGIQIDSTGSYNGNIKDKIAISNINIKKNQFINIKNSEIILYGKYKEFKDNIKTIDNTFIYNK